MEKDSESFKLLCEIFDDGSPDKWGYGAASHVLDNGLRKRAKELIEKIKGEKC